MNIIQSNLSFRSSLSYGNHPDTIVLHHAEASHCTVYDINQWHKENGWAGCGYHYFVNKQGQIYTGRPENAIGAHCPGENTHSIGICSEGNYMSETMPEAQKQSIIQLGIYIKNKYGVSRIGGHSEFFNTSCPGTTYPLSQIKEAIMGGSSSTINISTSSSSPSRSFMPNGTITQLQELIGANADGIPGPETLSKCPLLMTGSSGNIVKWLQYCLNSLCGSSLDMDGQFGRATQIAVQNYQARKRIAADGKFGHNSWSKILRLS